MISYALKGLYSAVTHHEKHSRPIFRKRGPPTLRYETLNIGAISSWVAFDNSYIAMHHFLVNHINCPIGIFFLLIGKLCSTIHMPSNANKETRT